MLNRAKECYQNNREALRQKARNRELSDDKKNIKKE